MSTLRARTQRRQGHWLSTLVSRLPLNQLPLNQLLPEHGLRCRTPSTLSPGEENPATRTWRPHPLARSQHRAMSRPPQHRPNLPHLRRLPRGTLHRAAEHLTVEHLTVEHLAVEHLAVDPRCAAKAASCLRSSSPEPEFEV
jgi:hypothetical protein